MCLRDMRLEGGFGVNKIADQDIMMRRFAIIYPLLNENLDSAERTQMRKSISEREGMSERTLYRWEERYRNAPKDGLIPMARGHGSRSKLPENYSAILAEAEDLKREVPTRSVRKIIRTLEINGTVEPGALCRSTMQKYFQKDGCTRRALTAEKKTTTNAARRFCKAHRMELIQTDIKYSHAIRATKNEPEKTFYLSTLLDDHSRFPLYSHWYANQKKEIVEDSIRQAIQKYGRFDKLYADNGSQYITQHLQDALSKLNIKIRYAPVRSGQSKGKVEKFHQVVDSFLAEAKAAKITTLEQMNSAWDLYRKAYYEDDIHAGIAEYYKVNNLPFPKEGRSPLQEFEQDSRPLEYINNDMIRIAFRHTEQRVVTKGGLIHLGGKVYGAPLEMRGLTVTVIFDPMATDSITILDKNGKEITATVATIGPYVGDWSKPEPAPAPARTEEGSRFLEAAKKYCTEQAKVKADALSFAGYGETGDSNPESQTGSASAN